MVGICELCKNEGELQLSHFIPSFMGKWHKKTSITGYLRNNLNISLRQQDLHKEYLLCGKCESVLSKWEKAFAEKVFNPYVENTGRTIEYDDWLLKFCVSLSWRTLIHIRKLNPGNDNLCFLDEVGKAKSKMEDFLNGKTECLDGCEQHLLPLDEIDYSSIRSMPTNINRYLLRSFGMDVIGNRKNIFIYTKMPYFILIGVVKSNETRIMKSSRIKMKRGMISPRKYEMPKGIGTYIFEKGRQLEELDKKIPEHQQARIREYLFRNPQIALDSKTFKAFLADLRMFGEDAFKKDDD